MPLLLGRRCRGNNTCATSAHRTLGRPYQDRGDSLALNALEVFCHVVLNHDAAPTIEDLIGTCMSAEHYPCRSASVSSSASQCRSKHSLRIPRADPST